MSPSSILFILIVIVSCLGQVSSDLYLPSLPSITRDLETTTSLTQLSVSLFMLGFSVSQLVYGPISDAFGRRKPLIVGLTICMLAGLACTFSPNIVILNISRLFQGLGAGAGMALARSILRDKYRGKELASMGSYVSITNVFVMASAPVVGGYLQFYAGWRSNFIALFLYALIAWLAVIFTFNESNEQIDRTSINFRVLASNLKTLVTHRDFMGYSLCTFLAYAGVLAWLTTSPILLQNEIGLTSIQFGWIAVLVGFAFVVGGLINAILVKRWGQLNMMRFGIFIMFISGLMMLSLSLLGFFNFIVIIFPLFSFLFGLAFIFPNSFSGAITPFPQMAGLSGALFGFLQILGGSLSSLLMSYLPSNSQTPISTVFISYAIIAGIISAFVLKKGAHEEE